MSNFFKYKYVPFNIWDTFILKKKKDYLFEIEIELSACVFIC